MAAYKKKIIVVLVIAALGSGVPAVCEIQSTIAGQTTEKSETKAGSLFANDPNFLVKPADELGGRELFFKMMFSVLLVVVLGAAAIYVLKKFGPGIRSLPGKKVRLIETVHLGHHKTLHLLKIGNRQLLIAGTSESITKLADVTDALSETDSSAQGTNNS